MTQERLVCGVHIIPLRDFITNTYDDGLQRQIHAALSEDAQHMLSSVDRSEWRPVKLVAEINRAIYRARGDDRAGYADMVAAGSAIGHYATNTFLRLLIKLMTPEIMARKWPTVWEKSHNFGSMRTELDSSVGRRLTMHLSDVDGYDYIGPTAVGFLTFSLKAMGMPEAKVLQHGDTTVQTAGNYHFEITW